LARGRHAREATSFEAEVTQEPLTRGAGVSLEEVVRAPRFADCHEAPWTVSHAHGAWFVHAWFARQWTQWWLTGRMRPADEVLQFSTAVHRTCLGAGASVYTHAHHTSWRKVQMADSTAGCVLHGTCGWSDPSIVTCGRFYPRSVKSSSDKLAVFSRTFACVEVRDFPGSSWTQSKAFLGSAVV
jgi:hypothetical protein